MKILPHAEIPTDIVDAPEESIVSLYRTCLLMENACIAADGVGLSAVQVGLPWRFFIARPDGKPNFRCFVNTEYKVIEDAGYQESVEGCLSILNESGGLRHFRVKRAKAIYLTGKELVTEPEPALMDVKDELVTGFFAIICQHEIDHQRQVLIKDIGDEVEVW